MNLATYIASAAPPAPATLLYQHIMPDWGKRPKFKPITTVKQSRTLNLVPMTPGGGKAKTLGWLPHKIFQASLEIDSISIGFSGDITCRRPKPGRAPTFYLGRTELSAKYTRASEINRAPLICPLLWRQI